MATATLTSKDQITMPQEVRQTLGLHTGDKVDFVPDDAGGFKIVALRKDVAALRRGPEPSCIALDLAPTGACIQSTVWRVPRVAASAMLARA